MCLCELSPFLALDNAIRSIALVGNEYFRDVLVSMLVDLLEPVGNVVERLLVSAIVHQDDPHRSLIIGLCDRAETLLPCGVPDLKLDALVVDVDLLDFEVYA